jgi:transposase, IS5 family
MEGRNKIMQLQLFKPEFGLKPSYLRFLHSDLGLLWRSLPFEDVAQSIEKIALKHGAHIPSWGGLDIKGALGAHVLKSYYNGLSDKKLVEKINLNEVYQWFCFSPFADGKQIKSKNVLWQWRVFLGTYLDLDSVNVVQLQHWHSALEHPHLRLSDATVYEVKIAYPTSVKLLWQSCEWVYGLIPRLGVGLGMGTLRALFKRYGDQYDRQRSYDKSRRKTHAQTHGRIRQLLFWLNKGLDLLKPLIQAYTQKSTQELLLKPLKKAELNRFETILTVYEQQNQLFNNPSSTIAGRIVSLHQPHIRPIVRGKELKKVEFGPKVNMLRIGGINLIEKVSFDNFNEGTRFQSTCTAYQELTGPCQQMGADAIYATNANRKFATQNKIATCFKIKGKLPANADKKNEKIKAIKTIHKIRASHMEGSFGNEKEHYDLMKIKAKTPKTQIATLFCNILTANAMTLIARQNKKNKDKNKKNKNKEDPKIKVA